MGQRHETLSPALIDFIRGQQMFFVATAPKDGHVNLSPKGLDSLRVLGPRSVAWLNVTGSGNESAAHVRENGRMTLMFCAFEGRPLILRLYGTARVVHPQDEDWPGWLAEFGNPAGARQVFVLALEFAHTSCGMGVPLYDFRAQRNELVEWAQKKGPEGILEYWQRKNRRSLDGLPTGILDEAE